MGKSFKGFSKALSLILAVAMVVTCVPTSAYAAELLTDASEDILVNDTVAEEASDALVDASASEEKSSTSIDTQKEADLATAPNENKSGKEDFDPDTTALDVKIDLAAYTPGTPGSTNASHQHLEVESYYASDYDVYSAAGVNNIGWASENDFNFYIDPMMGYDLELSSTTDKLFTATYREKDSAGTAYKGTPVDIASSDFTVGEPDSDGRVLVTIKSAFFEKAVEGRTKADVDSGAAADGITITVTNKAKVKTTQMPVPTVDPDGGTGTIPSFARDTYTASYYENYKLVLSSAVGVEGDISSVTVKAKQGKTATKVTNLTPQTGTITTLDKDTWSFSGGTAGYYFFDEATSTLWIHHSEIQKIIDGDDTEAAIVVKFAKSGEATKTLAIRVPDTTYVDYHVGKDHATVAKVNEATDVYIAFKPSGTRTVSDILYTIDTGSTKKSLKSSLIGPGTHPSDGFGFTLVDSSTYDETTNPFSEGWYELSSPGNYTATAQTDVMTVVEDPTSYVTIPDGWFTYSGSSYTPVASGGIPGAGPYYYIDTTKEFYYGDITLADVAHTPNGWYVAMLPARYVIGTTITFYAETKETVTIPAKGSTHATIVGMDPTKTTGSGAVTDYVVTGEPYTFNVTADPGYVVKTVTYTVDGGSAKSLTVTDSGEYTIPATDTVGAIDLGFTTEAATSAQKGAAIAYNKSADSPKAAASETAIDLATVTTMDGTSLASSAANVVTRNEYFYFVVAPTTGKMFTNVYTVDMGGADTETLVPAIKVTTKSTGAVVYRTAEKASAADVLRVYVDGGSAYSITEPTNTKVNFTGATSAAAGSTYTFTVTPETSSNSKIYITDILNNGSVIWSSATGTTSAISQSIVNISADATLTVYTREEMNASEYTSEFTVTNDNAKNPVLVKNGTEKTLELRNGETIALGTSTGNLKVDIKDKNNVAIASNLVAYTTAEIATGTKGVRGTAWSLGKTETSNKIADFATGTFTANKLASITGDTDTITVKHLIADTDDASNTICYTATLPLKVDDRFKSLKLVSTNAGSGSDGYLIKGTSKTETFTLAGVDGRTEAEGSLNKSNDLSAVTTAVPKPVEWTVSPDYSGNTDKVYTWGIESTSDQTEKQGLNAQFAWVGAETQTGNTTVSAVVTDKWGKAYPAATATMALVDEPVATTGSYVVIPTITVANGKATALKATNITPRVIGTTAPSNTISVEFAIYEQQKNATTPITIASSDDDIKAALANGSIATVDPSTVDVTWAYDNYIVEQVGDGSAAVGSGLYDKGSAAFKVSTDSPSADGKEYYKKSSTDVANGKTNEFITITGSGLSYTITSKETTHNAKGTGYVYAKPTFKVNGITLAAANYAASLGTEDCAITVDVAERIAKHKVRLYVDDTKVPVSSTDSTIKSQKLTTAYINGREYSEVTKDNKVGTKISGIEFTQIEENSAFALPKASDFDTSLFGTGRTIYGWTDGAGSPKFYEPGEVVAIVADSAFYPLFGPKYVVEHVFNTNLATYDKDGKITGTTALDPSTALDVPVATATSKTKPGVALGVKVLEVKGVVSTAKAATLTKTAGSVVFGDPIFETANVAIAVDGTNNNNLTATANKVSVEQIGGSGTKINVGFKKDNVEYPFISAAEVTKATADAVTASVIANVKVAAGTSPKIAATDGYLNYDDSTKGQFTVKGIANKTNYTVSIDDLTAAQLAGLKAGTAALTLTATALDEDSNEIADFGDSSYVKGIYKWESSNPEVLKITGSATPYLDEATMQPLKAGSAKVTFTWTSENDVTYTAEKTFTVAEADVNIKFVDKDGAIIADPEFIETYAGASATNTYYVAAYDKSGNRLSTGGFTGSTSAANSWTISYTDTDSVKLPGVKTMTATGNATYGKSTIQLIYTAADSVVYYKEMTFKTYRKVLFKNTGIDGYIVKGQPVYVDGTTNYDKTEKHFVKIYSDSPEKTVDPTNDAKFKWTYTVDVKDYAAVLVNKDFSGWILTSAAGGTDVISIDNTTKSTKTTFTVSATTTNATDNTLFAISGDLNLNAKFDNAAITNVSGIPGTIVKLNDTKTTGTDATTNTVIELGVTPYNTASKITAKADKTGLIQLFDPAGGGSYTYNTTNVDSKELTPDPTASTTKLRTDKLGVGMVKGKAGKTIVHLTNGQTGDAKVEYGSFTVAISGAKYDSTGNVVEGYYDENGELLKNTSKEIGGKTYYFGDDGKTVTNGVVVIDGKLVLIAGGVKETATGLHTLEGKTYCIKADGTVAKSELSTVAGKQYYFRADGSMVKSGDADVKGGKFTDPKTNVTYVIAEDNTAKPDKKMVNATFEWTTKKPAKFEKTSALPTNEYKITYNFEGESEKLYATGTVTAVADPSDYKTVVGLKKLTLTFTASESDLAGFFSDSKGEKALTATPAVWTYTFSGSSDIGTGGGIEIQGFEEGQEFKFTGSAIKPAVEVWDNDLGVKLTLGVDYSLSYKNNTKITTDASKTPVVTVNGKGNYVGKTVTRTFKIVDPREGATDLTATVKKIELGFGSASPVYNGEPWYPESITVDGNAFQHSSGEDYTTDSTANYVFSFSNNTDAGTATVGVTGQDGKTKKKTFKIAKVDLSKVPTANLEISPADADWTVKGAVPATTVTYTPEGGSAITLVEGQDYTLKVNYADRKKNVADNNTVTITGKGTNFAKKATSTETFKIEAYTLSDANILEVVAPAGAKVKAVKATVVDGNGVKINKKDYTVNVYDSEDTVLAPTATLTAGSTYKVEVVAPPTGNIAGSGSFEFTAAADMSKAKVTLSKDLKKNGVAYTGEPIVVTAVQNGELIKNLFETDITVEYKNPTTKKYEKLTYDEDFEVLGYQNNVKKGNMTVYIRAKEDSTKVSGVKYFKIKISAKTMKKAD